VQDFRDLRVWQKSHELVLRIYRVTEDFPKTETYGLVSQIRRAGASIPTNIAEGCGRGTDADFARFLQIALGSASEVDYQLILCRDLKYIETAAYDELDRTNSEAMKMLTSLIRKLRTNSQ